MGRNNENHWKWETHTVEHGMWQESLKTWNKRNTHWRTWYTARNDEKHGKLETHTVEHSIRRETLQNMENEKHTLWNMEHGKKKHWKTWKISNAHFRRWYVVRKFEKHGKWETHTWEHGIWLKKTLKSIEKWQRHTWEHGI